MSDQSHDEHHDASAAESTGFKRSLAWVVAGVGALVAVSAAFSAFTAVTAPSRVPALIPSVPRVAEAALRQNRLVPGAARYVPVRGFTPGLIIAQSSRAFSQVPSGTVVGVGIAVEPSITAVPDVVGAERQMAEDGVRFKLFEPRLLYSYSPTVEAGRVIEQLPRAGDTAETGTSVTLVVSLGTGAKGMIVPSLVGSKLSAARSKLTSATMFAQVREVVTDTASTGVVVDQVPAAGSLVELATQVALAVATPTPAPGQ
jgi:beta-lactam-binding protein with PASTA domain